MPAPTNNADFLQGTNGPDILRGLGGNDTILGNAGNDKIYGDAGNDYLYGGYYSNLGSGNDFIVGGAGNDNIFDFDGNNTLSGGVGNDLIYAGSGSDTIFGDDGSDLISAGNGDDLIYVIDDDIVEGGFGTDEINFSFLQLASGVTLNLSLLTRQATGAAGSVKVNSIEDVYGTWRNDVFVGNVSANFLDGASGNDRLSGGLGNDRLWGGIGNDILTGGPGNDVLKGFFGRDTYIFSSPLNPATNKDFIEGFSTADDTIHLARSVFSRLGGPGALAPDAFTFGSAARDAEDRIVYDNARGHLYYDADGTGSAFGLVMFAYVQPRTAMFYTDFVVI